MSTRTVIGVLVAGLCLGAVPAPGRPLQKNEVSPAAKWVIHADVEAFRNSGIGKLIMAELQAQGLEEKLQGFADIFSFHPLKDVRDVTVYGRDKDRNNAVIAIDGQFDPEKVLAVVRWNPQHQEIPYQGVTIHQWPNEENKNGQTTTQTMYGYLHNGRLIVLSAGLDALKQAVDTLKGPAAGTASALLSQVPEGRNSVFVQAAALHVDELVGENPQAALLKQAEVLTLTAGQTTDNVSAELHLHSASPEVADNLVKMLQGVVAWLQMATQEQPRLSELAKGVNVARADKVAQVHFEAPAPSVLAFVKEQLDQKKQPPKPTP
jgi:hypothetical protein